MRQRASIETSTRATVRLPAAVADSIARAAAAEATAPNAPGERASSPRSPRATPATRAAHDAPITSTHESAGTRGRPSTSTSMSTSMSRPRRRPCLLRRIPSRRPRPCFSRRVRGDAQPRRNPRVCARRTRRRRRRARRVRGRRRRRRRRRNASVESVAAASPRGVHRRTRRPAARRRWSATAAAKACGEGRAGNRGGDGRAVRIRDLGWVGSGIGDADVGSVGVGGRRGAYSPTRRRGRRRRPRTRIGRGGPRGGRRRSRDRRLRTCAGGGRTRTRSGGAGGERGKGIESSLFAIEGGVGGEKSLEGRGRTSVDSTTCASTSSDMPRSRRRAHSAP